MYDIGESITHETLAGIDGVGAFTKISQLAPEWLTARLKESGFLYSGEVVTISQRSNRATLFARIWHLEIDYSSDTPLSAPRNLFVKLSRPDKPANNREVAFYQNIESAMLGHPCLTAMMQRIR